MATTRDRLLRAYRRQLGVHESPYGSNRVRYSEVYGLIGPWCHMMISVVARETEAGDIVPWAAYTPAGAEWFKAQRRWHSTPKKGAIVYYEFPGMGRISHVGVVEAVHSDGTISAIEGNTDAYGGRTGGKVMRKRRSRSLVAGYGYPAYISEGKYQALKKAAAQKRAAAVLTRKKKTAATGAAAAVAALIAAGVILAPDGGSPAKPAPRPTLTASPPLSPGASPRPTATPTAKPIVQTRVIHYVKGRKFQQGADVQRVAKVVGVPANRVRKGWGPTADLYLREWQKRLGLTVDGRFGARCVRLLGWSWRPAK
jgi:surface antigen